jgi:hypothetical protein
MQILTAARLPASIIMLKESMLRSEDAPDRMMWKQVESGCPIS